MPSSNTNSTTGRTSGKNNNKKSYYTIAELEITGRLSSVIFRHYLLGQHVLTKKEQQTSQKFKRSHEHLQSAWSSCFLSVIHSKGLPYLAWLLPGLFLFCLFVCLFVGVTFKIYNINLVTTDRSKLETTYQILISSPTILLISSSV